ncbi:hypothetical protein SEA_ONEIAGILLIAN_3 [Microbacterium phage OneinaGillian]|uniref:Uncharacterized protein n=1 Tax=Microbacterium phage OneinaGillian TaxID=2301604 RepID=A0A385UH38_9CAUD|nr:hypothetical protein HOU23_gp003 [Microbacterium phage OneinaGillian]AYB70113.1 hypothetical protein SEA_ONEIAGILLIAN_3 [Microbacterium phage OneinaGillian]
MSRIDRIYCWVFGHDWEMISYSQGRRFSGTGLAVVHEECTQCRKTQNVLRPIGGNR